MTNKTKQAMMDFNAMFTKSGSIFRVSLTSSQIYHMEKLVVLGYARKNYLKTGRVCYNMWNEWL